MNTDFNKIVSYARSHWKSEIREEWQVGPAEYQAILKNVLKDFTKEKTLNKKIVRIAGISGSGKTTQLLPAAESFFKVRNMSPVLIAAREFVKYHPHYEDIKNTFGEANLRKMTDEFSTIMLFLTLSELIKAGYDIILDVSLLDPSMEQILQQLLSANSYEQMMLLIAVSSEVAATHLEGRDWRHSKETEEEFVRATSVALRFYAEKYSKIRVIIWDTFSPEPIYDGEISGAPEVFENASSITDIPPHSEDILRTSKIDYLSKQ